MARVTIFAVENVPGYAAMAWIHLNLCMACRALEDAIIGRIGMTCCTHSSGVPMIRCKPGMVERCTCPRCRRVARFTGRGVAGSRVVWICRAFEIVCVARITAAVNELIITVRMA
jgi:hypothetical protein